jgi:AhpD family alkylhydroperoxidase
MTYRFFTPAPPRAATGVTAQVYAQLRDDFIGPAPTFRALSAAPEIMAATWALMRETLLAEGPGEAGRVDREVVAAAVSLANRCRFCVDAHVTLLHALGEHALAHAVTDSRASLGGRADLVRWAADSRHPRANGWAPSADPRLDGVVLAFHFINRMVSALLTPDLLPGGLQRLPAVRAAGGRLYARSIRRPVEPGRGLSMLDAGPAGVPGVAGPAPGDPIDRAYAALRAATTPGGLLGGLAADTVTATVRREDGRFPDRSIGWATDLARDLPAADRVGARIALLAAFDPAAITPGDVGLWRLSHPGDADLVRLVAFGAFAATDHVSRAHRPAHS